MIKLQKLPSFPPKKCNLTGIRGYSPQGRDRGHAVYPSPHGAGGMDVGEL